MTWKTTKIDNAPTDAINGRLNASDWNDMVSETTGHMDNVTTNPHNVTKSQVGLGNVTNDAQMPISYLDTDGTLSTNTDLKVPSEKAIRTYISNNCLPVTGTITRLNKIINNSTIKVVSIGSYDTIMDSPAINDRYQFRIYAIGNETKLSFSNNKFNTRAVYDLYINGVRDSGGYDDYTSTSTNAQREVTLSNSLIAGYNLIELVVIGKSSFSSNYSLACYGMRLY